MLNFIYSEKATKFCEISTLLLTGTTKTKVRGRFRKILWPSQNIWSLTKRLQMFFINWNKNFEKLYQDRPISASGPLSLLHAFHFPCSNNPCKYFDPNHRSRRKIKRLGIIFTCVYNILAYMATSGGHFSRPSGMGSFWS